MNRVKSANSQEIIEALKYNVINLSIKKNELSSCIKIS